MIKINLLPPHINQKRMVRNAAIIVTVLVAAEVAGLVWAMNAPKAQQEVLNTTLADRSAKLTQVQGVKTDADAVLAEQAAIRPKYDFVTGMLEFNKKYPDLYTRTAGYTWREIMFLNLEASGNTLKFDAYTPTPVDVSRMMVMLTKSPDFSGIPQVTGIPGFNAEEERARRAASQQEGMSGSTIIGGQIVGGPGGDMSGGDPGMGGGAGPGAGMSPGGNGPGAGPGAMSGPGAMGASSAGSAGAAGAGGGNGPSGAGGGGGGGGGSLAALNIDGATRKPRGFTVSVNCNLKAPISRPGYGSFAGGAASGGGAGGGGGNGPSMGGGMGGSGMGNGPGK